ncbi:MAG: mechanosensitive ion channel family protein [Geitlerinemataceae cyanobacterium]
MTLRSLAVPAQSPDLFFLLDAALDVRSLVPASGSFWPSVLTACGGLLAFGFVVLGLPSLLAKLSDRASPSPIAQAVGSLMRDRNRWVSIALGLTVCDLGLRWYSFSGGFSWWSGATELAVALTLSVVTGWLLTQVFARWFDSVLVDVATRPNPATNGELLLVAKFIGNGAIVAIVAVLFAETHDLNAIGLLTSLGIGGLAIAFAAQKTLEQIVGGVVLYLDRPFLVDDYIALPDGTFGRVESIGLRSTKIRVSGKGTVMVVPNNVLTGERVENYSDAKKVMASIDLDLFRKVSQAERASIESVILAATRDIFGLDPRSTSVTFRKTTDDVAVQVQVNLFILGSREMSMDLRRQLLDIARQNISQTLIDYGIDFAISDAPTYIDAPISL